MEELSQTMKSTVAIVGFSNPACRIACHLADSGAELNFYIDEKDQVHLPLLPSSVFLCPVTSLRPDLLPQLPLGVSSVIIATDNEQFNIHAALNLSDSRPELRIVVRLFNLGLGREIEERLDNVKVLSVSELAAPLFAASALKDGVTSARRTEELLIGTVNSEETEFHAEEIPLAACNKIETCPIRLPKPDTMLIAVLVSIFFIVTSATAFFSLRHNLNPGDALYFVVTTLTTTGYGDFSLRDYPFSTKLAGMAVMLSGASLFAILFALMTDKLFRLRLDILMGRRQVRSQGHIIVCGAGDVGIRVVESLLLAGAKVVVVERDQEGRFIQRLRDMGVSLVIADATLEETLQKAGAVAARAVICATDSDMRNLETALNARSLNPSLRLVLRIYDREFAERIKSSFGVDAALSSSAIAAPAFAEAAMGRRLA